MCYNRRMRFKIKSKLVTLAKKSSGDIYIVGGYLRNHFAYLNQAVVDIDLCGASMGHDLFESEEYKVKLVNKKLETCTIIDEDDKYEYTPFRTESYGSGGEHTPSCVVFTKDLYKDCLRRDFTCNSIYYNIKTGEFIDPHGGIQDTKNKIIRAFNPELIFADDGLRLLRLVRIACETGFRIDPHTEKTAISNAELLKDISKERIRDEFNKILVADTKYGVKDAHYRGLKLLCEYGFMDYIIPELLEGRGIAQNEKYHAYDVLEHNLMVCRYSHPLIRLAGLLHDVGKPRAVDSNGRMIFHDKYSCEIAKEVLGNNGLKYSKADVDEISLLCKNHMYDLDCNTSDKKLKLFVVKNWDIIDKLVLLNNADRLGSGKLEPYKKHRFTICKESLVKDKAPLKIADLKIKGTDLSGIGYKGKSIGLALEEAFSICIDNPTNNNFDWLKQYLDKNKNKF